MGAVVGVDVGGTKVLAGAVAADGEVLRTARGTTPGRHTSPEAIEEALVDAVHAASGPEPVEAVGLAAAGFVSGGRVRFAPHLPWRDDDVAGRLARRLGVPVALDNDANCAAIAEATYGAGRDTPSFVLLTLGTGIGGAVVVDGRVWRGAQGMAGEFGHMRVVPDGIGCECGRRGCWEQYSSGNALIREARTRLGVEPTVLQELCDGDPTRLTGPMVTTAAQEGDLVARAAFSSVGHWLGVGLANVVAALDPALVVVGGGLAESGDRLLDPAREALARSLVAVDHRIVPPLRPAALGAAAGMVGAALLARGQSRR
ncbi:ROK family protein [Nocardioides coralli]|uniref:ROK family protein n=1 Tax=Nocardioides coralli TaxID=2872154 RepID=UPI001CA3CDEC|nr:ROK family protein [Nocardioides coralli]QZY28004.1 ROK family protein [Nocardioides coralli]